MSFSVIFLYLFLPTDFSFGSEPVCSRFHYEEKTLEKMIRQEIVVERMKADLDATKQHVLEALSDLKKEREQFASDLEGKTNDIEMIKETIDKTIDDVKTQNERNIGVYSAEMEKMKDTVVSFEATLSHATDCSSGQYVIFDRVKINQGSAYDNSTGVFTAQENGTYHISLTLMSPGDSKGVRVGVKKNSQSYIGYLYSKPEPSWEHRSTSVLIYLYVGDYLSIECIGASSLYGSVSGTQSGGCEQLGSCICVFENGSKIDLTELGNKDGSPLIKDYKADEPYAYSFNPCYPFTEGDCKDVAGCQINEVGDLFYRIGDSNSANFTYVEGVLVGVYTSIDDIGTVRTSVVSYICDHTAETPQVNVFGERPVKTYRFSIKSKYACVSSLFTPTPTPTPTAKKSCHTNYGDFIKRCEVDYDGHEEPVKVLFIRNWNGNCKFPSDKDVAVTLYSETSTCAGVTNRCNPVQAFSVNGIVCKEIN